MKRFIVTVAATITLLVGGWSPIRAEDAAAQKPAAALPAAPAEATEVQKAGGCMPGGGCCGSCAAAAAQEKSDAAAATGGCPCAKNKHKPAS